MPKKPHKIRVLSYNIHQGLTVYKKQIALSILKDAIKSLKADVVLLQEVAGLQSSKRKVTEEAASFQLEALADEIWPYTAYGKNAVFSGGFHGNAILSRFPIKQFKNVDISVKNMIRRGVLHATLEMKDSGKELHVVATHLGLLQIERTTQVRKLCQYLQKSVPSQSPLIIGGDFNDWREKVTQKLSKNLSVEEAFLKSSDQHARTFPSRFPVLRLDRIYFRGVKLNTTQRPWGRPWLLLSDHLPLVAEFQID